MNRLWVRLTFAFVAITLLSVALVSTLANSAATNQFHEYLYRQEIVNQSGLVDDLAAYYQTNHSWQGVAVVMDASAAGQGQGRGRMRGTTSILADAAGIIQFGANTGAILSDAEKASALPIRADGTTFGYLLMSSPGRGALNQAQQAFLDQLQENLITAAIIAGLLAIALGLLISRALAMPLASLANAAQLFGQRQWSQRIKPQGTREIADVANAMNNMAASLQEIEAQRRDMVADIAHELRTPVSVIQGNLRAMLDGVYPLERAEIATIYDETRLLNRLIDDLRELALAESGQMTLNLQSVNPSEIVRSTAEHFEAVADAQDIRLNVQMLPNLPPVRADADRLAQVLRNLLINAMRFTPTGGTITLSVVHTAPTVTFSVQDTGPGIAPQDKPYLFDRFYRGDRSRARNTGGTGLGLAIAKSLIEAMGGQIGVESVVGAGSTFWFHLPT